MWRYIVLCILWGTEVAKGGLITENYQMNATVGGYVIMNCHLDFPFGNEIPYQLEWDKDVNVFVIL